ncbi:unnamed protein product [Mucor hiemalis]
MLPVNHDIQHNSSGFSSPFDFQRFQESADTSNVFLLKYMDRFLNTMNIDTLTFIGRSKLVGKKTKEAIEVITNPWRADAIKNVLKFLKHIPFELTILIDNDLGYALKNIKKTATSKNDNEIVSMSSKIINDWKLLQKPSNGVKRDSPERSSASPPTPEAKKLKLAIQKEPPMRPKAMADPNFFPTLGEQKKFRRPVYVVDENDNNAFKATSGVITFAPSSGATTDLPRTVSPPSNKKRVTFSDKLFEVREYEKNPEEWTSFDDQSDELDRFYSSQYVNQVEAPPKQFNVPSIEWYQPRELHFNIDENPSVVIPKLIRTEESASQDRREKIALAAIYTSPLHIPSSPGEPDEVPNPNEDTRFIPLEDVADGYNPPQSQEPSLPTMPTSSMLVVPQFIPQTVTQPVTQPVTPPATQTVAQNVADANLISPAALNVLYAVVNQTLQKAPPSQTVQQPVVQAVPVYNRPLFAPHQTGISNSAVESMLKNNPGIMNSLKHLSFLAGSDLPVPQAQAVNGIYQDINTLPQYNHINNKGNNRPSKNHKNFTRGGGRGGRGRGNTYGSNIPPGACAFFKTAEGCRNGDNCPFSHER